MVFCFFNYFKSVCYNCFTVSFPLSFLFYLFTYNVLLKWRKKFFHSHFSNIHYLQNIYIYCKLLFFPFSYVIFSNTIQKSILSNSPPIWNSFVLNSIFLDFLPIFLFIFLFISKRCPEHVLRGHAPAWRKAQPGSLPAGITRSCTSRALWIV